jgi:hypothetical protein
MGANAPILFFNFYWKHYTLCVLFAIIQTRGDDMFSLQEISQEELEKKLLSTKNVKLLMKRYKIQEELIDKYADTIFSKYWKEVSYLQNLSEGFIERHADKLCWSFLAVMGGLSERLITKYMDRLKPFLCDICRTKILSDSFIEENASLIGWINISTHHKVSYAFAVKHIDSLSVELLKSNRRVNQEELEPFYLAVHLMKG